MKKCLLRLIFITISILLKLNAMELVPSNGEIEKEQSPQAETNAISQVIKSEQSSKPATTTIQPFRKLMKQQQEARKLTSEEYLTPEVDPHQATKYAATLEKCLVLDPSLSHINTQEEENDTLEQLQTSESENSPTSSSSRGQLSAQHQETKAKYSAARKKSLTGDLQETVKLQRHLLKDQSSLINNLRNENQEYKQQLEQLQKQLAQLEQQLKYQRVEINALKKQTEVGSHSSTVQNPVEQIQNSVEQKKKKILPNIPQHTSAPTFSPLKPRPSSAGSAPALLKGSSKTTTNHNF